MSTSIPDGDAAQGAAPRIFDPLDVAASEQLIMPEGLVGFPACHAFALVPAGLPGCSWLRSLDHTTLALLVVDPFLYFPGYSIDVPPPVMAKLQATEPADVSVQAVATLGGAHHGATANLQAPLIFNVQRRSGYQYVCPDASWGMHEPIVPPRTTTI